MGASRRLGEALLEAASRVREAFGTAHDLLQRCKDSANAERPGGGHPIRVVGGYLEGYLEVETKSAGTGLAVERDHADLGRILVAAVDHLLAHERTAIALGAGSGVLG